MLGPDAIELVIASPEIATWTDANTIEVSGSAKGLAEVTVNETTVIVEGNTWTHTLPVEPGIQQIGIRGVDKNGFAHVRRRSFLAGTFADDTATASNVIGMRVNKGGIERGLEALPVLFAAETVEAEILQNDLIIEDDLFWVYATGLDYDPPIVEIDLSEGVLGFSVSLHNAAMTFWYDGPLAWNGDASMTASAIRISADVALDIFEGDFSAEVPSAVVEIDDFTLDVDYSLGIEHLFQGAVEDAIEDAVSEALTTDVGPFLEQSFAKFDPSFSSSVLATEFSVNASFEALSIDEDGIEVGVGISVDVTGPEETSHPYVGRFDLPFDPEPLSHDSDIAMVMSDNLVNHLLNSVWYAALLEDIISTSDGTLSAVWLALAGATEGTLGVDMMLPPVLVDTPEGLELQIGGFIMELDTIGAPLGDHLKMEIAANLPVSFVMMDEAVIFSAGEIEVNVDAADNDWVVRPEEIASRLVEGLPLDLVTEVATGIEIPLPTYDDVGIENAQLFRDAHAAATVITFDIR